jgi:hypothetical protein
MRVVHDVVLTDIGQVALGDMIFRDVALPLGARQSGFHK